MRRGVYECGGAEGCGMIGGSEMRPALLKPSVLPVLACVLLAACGESSEPASTSARATVGAVTRSERTWVDTTRRTPPNSLYEGAPTRTVRTLIWQPATRTPLPLLVMAHGFDSLPEWFDALASTIAAAGFVVAAPAFPVTNHNAPGDSLNKLADAGQQPADMSFVITQLLAAGATPGDTLDGRIIADDVAVLGLSLGGTTVIALTRKDCCRDPRVRASLLFAAAPIDILARLFGTDAIAAGPPTLVAHGTADRTLPYAGSQLLYAQIDAPKVFLGIAGADHADAVFATTLPLTALQNVSQRAIVGFLNTIFRGEDAAFDGTLAALAAEGNTVQRAGTLP
jgi:predicted dienelactone hydrolase